MPPVPDHTKFIAGCLTLIALVAMSGTTYLVATGYQAGELMVGIASASAGSLGTMLAMRRTPNNSVGDNATITTPAGPAKSDTIV